MIGERGGTLPGLNYGGSSGGALARGGFPAHLGHQMARAQKGLVEIAPEDREVDVARRAIKDLLKGVSRHSRRIAESRGNPSKQVHQLRVTCRRAAAAVKFFRPLLPGKPRKWIKGRLKQLRDAASEARDLDVLLASLAPSNLAKTLTGQLEARRDAAYRALRRVCRTKRKKGKVRRKSKALLAGIEAPELENAPEGSDAGDWLRSQLRPLVREFLRRARGKLSTLAALHQFRIAGKELRYALELAVGAVDKSTHCSLITALKGLQERLGKVCDHHAAIQTLQDLLKETENVTDRRRLRTKLASQSRALVKSQAGFHKWWSSGRAARLSGYCKRAGIAP